MKSIITITAAAAVLLAGASASRAADITATPKPAAGIAQTTAGSVYNYVLTISPDGEGLTFVISQRIVLSGLSGVTGASLSGDLADTSGTLNGNAENCIFKASFTKTTVTIEYIGIDSNAEIMCKIQRPGSYGTLQVTSTSTTAGTINFAIKSIIVGTTRGPVGPAFAGTPGEANCQGDSISALAQQNGGLEAAASALGFDSADALQDAVKGFCGD